MFLGGLNFDVLQSVSYQHLINWHHCFQLYEPLCSKCQSVTETHTKHVIFIFSYEYGKAEVCVFLSSPLILLKIPIDVFTGAVQQTPNSFLHCPFIGNRTLPWYIWRVFFSIERLWDADMVLNSFQKVTSKQKTLYKYKNKYLSLTNVRINLTSTAVGGAVSPFKWEQIRPIFKISFDVFGDVITGWPNVTGPISWRTTLFGHILCSLFTSSMCNGITL